MRLIPEISPLQCSTFTKAARFKCLYKEGTITPCMSNLCKRLIRLLAPLALLLCKILLPSRVLELLSTLGRFSLDCNSSQPPRALYKCVAVTTNFFYLKCKDVQTFCSFKKKKFLLPKQVGSKN